MKTPEQLKELEARFYVMYDMEITGKHPGRMEIIINRKDGGAESYLDKETDTIWDNHELIETMIQTLSLGKHSVDKGREYSDYFFFQMVGFFDFPIYHHLLVPMMEFMANHKYRRLTISINPGDETFVKRIMVIAYRFNILNPTR